MILAIVVAVSMPVVRAGANVHTFYTNTTTVGTCGTLCKGLSTSPGTTSTSTVVNNIAEAASPTIDANSNSKKTGTWSSGTTFTITGLSTTSTSDSILLVVETNPDTISVSTSTRPSAPGITFDGTSRTIINPAGFNMHLEEWHGIASSTLSSVTTTITLSGTPTSASGAIIAINGAEDPTSTFTVWDKASGYPGTGSKTAGGNNVAPGLAAGVTALNADDLIIGMFGDVNSVTETAGSGFTLDLTVASSASVAVEHKSDTVTASETCPFGATDSRWVVICDAYQSKPTYYKVEPETSASLPGTPSISANGFSGTGWVWDTAGLDSSALVNDIQATTWALDMKAAVGLTTGAPVARYFVTAWQCTTDSCTTATFLWNNWDTATNIAGSTSQTPHGYTTASELQVNSWGSSNYLAFEVWIAWQYSGSTSSTTMTFTTVDNSMDFKTPGWDYAKGLSGTLTLAGSQVKTLGKSLTGSLGLSTSFSEHTSLLRSLTGSLTLAGAETKGLAKSLSGSVSLAASQIKGLAKSLTGSLTLASSLIEKNSFFRTVAASITFTMVTWSLTWILES